MQRDVFALVKRVWGRKRKVCFSICLAYDNQKLDLNLLYYLGIGRKKPR